MSVKFSFCGKIKSIAESEKFKPFEVKTFPTGWAIKTLKFQGVDGDNSHFFQIKSGYWANEDGSVNADKTKIYTLAKPVGDNKAKSIAINYEDRLDQEVIDSITDSKKFIVDMNAKGSERDSAKRKEYIFEDDFLNCINSLLSKTDFISENKFYIVGEIDVKYSEQNGKFYYNYIVNKIALADPEAEEKMNIFGKFIFNADSWDEDNYEDTGRIALNCWAQYYDPAYKKDSCKGVFFAPFSLTIIPEEIRAKGDGKKDPIALFKSRITGIGSNYGTSEISSCVIDGAQLEKFTEDDLDEEAKENIEYGLSTVEDELKKLNGKRAYGDRITEYRVYMIGRSSDTAYTDETVAVPEHDAFEEVKPQNDDIDDIFDI